MVYRAWVLNEILETEISQPVGRGVGKGAAASPTGPKAPWNTQAADLVTELHAQSRRMESDLNQYVVGRIPLRGSSSRNTWLALYHVTDLMAGAPDRTVLGLLVEMRRWVGKAETTLGQSDPIHRLPREFGQNDPVCPWCSYMTLRCYVRTGTVFCVNPGCRDEDGVRPRANIDVSETGDLTLVWHNGVSIVPRPPVKEAA